MNHSLLTLKNTAFGPTVPLIVDAQGAFCGVGSCRYYVGVIYASNDTIEYLYFTYPLCLYELLLNKASTWINFIFVPSWDSSLW